MILVIILLILIVLLIFDIFRYNKVKANAFSEYELKKAAEEEAKKLEYKDPFITCEYCGAKIDTHKDKCCSNCGAPYDLNEEWKERHSLKDSFIKDGTDAVNEKREKKALVWCNEILKRMRLEIIIIAGITVSILGMSVLGYYIYDYHKYRRNEDVNKGSYQNFVKADYRIIGDGIIYDKDGVTVTVTDIYKDADPVNAFENDGKQAAKIGFRVQNKLGKNINLVIKCSGVNGIYCERSYIYSYDYFRKNADVTFYEELLYPKGSDLYELLFDYIEARATRDGSSSLIALIVLTERREQRELSRASMFSFLCGKLQLFKQYLIPSLYINLIVSLCRISLPVHGGCCYAY